MASHEKETEDISGALSDFHSTTQSQTAPSSDEDESKQIMDAGINKSLAYRLLERFDELEDFDTAVMSLALLIPSTPKTNDLYRAIHAYLSALDTLDHKDARIDRSISIQEQGIPYVPDSHPEKHSLLRDLGSFIIGRFERLGEIEDLNKAINLYKQSISFTPKGHPDLPAQLRNLGACYQSRFEKLHERANIDSASECKSQAIALFTEGEEARPALIGTLGESPQSQLQPLQEVSDIDYAISLYHQATSLIPEGDPRMPAFLSDLGTAYENRFGRWGVITDIDNAIACNSQAVSLLPVGYSNRHALLNNLASCHRQRFEHLGEISDINRSIELHMQADSLVLDGHVHKPVLLRNVAIAHQRRFERLGELPDIERAIACNIHSLSLIPEAHPNRSTILDSLGSSYHSRFEGLGNVDDIENAISSHNQAVLCTQEGDKSKPKRLSNLGISYKSRFERLGSLPDINSAIGFQAQAITLSPDRHPDMPVLLFCLATSYQDRFERLGDPSDLKNAIDSVSGAISLTPEEHADRFDQFNSLGGFYLRRFELRGDLSDIDKAITYLSRVVLLAPDGHASMAGWLNTLGVLYIRRFERLGNISDIDSAIDYGKRAILLCSNYNLKPKALGSLGSAYNSRFKRLGGLEDIDNSIAYQDQAISLTPEEHIDRPARLNNLGTSYESRFERFENRADIDRAVEYKREALLRTPEGHIDLPSRLSDLGISLEIRFRLLRERVDIDEAVACHFRGVSLNPQGHAQELLLKNNLGESHRTRFEHLGELNDIESSIDYLEQAVLVAPEQHADRPHLLNNLGISYQRQGEHAGDGTTIEKAIACFQKAARSIIGSPLTKFKAARSWARLSCSWNISAPLEAYRLAMSHVPRIVWVGTTVGHRYKDVASVGDVAIEAAATAIALQEHDLALEWLEQGRSIVWSQMLQLRTPLDKLASVDTPLAEKLYQAAQALEQASTENIPKHSLMSDTNSLERATQQHHQLAETWDQLVAQARLLPGFHDFLRPKKASDLLQAAHSGAVVVINIHESRCDAIVLQAYTTSITHVPLPTFSYTQAAQIRTQMAASLQGAGVRARDNRHPVFHEVDNDGVFKGMLGALWAHVAKPILGHLGYLQPQPGDKLPRITWCTTGPLAFLPIHAAGCYDEPHSRVFEYVISSYTPTLQALLTPPGKSPEFNGILAIGQAKATAGGGALPGTVYELAEIEKQAGKLPFTKLAEEDATPVAVLAGMKLHSWVHLACHATQKTVEPTKSAFLLHDGTLSLESISQNSFKNAGFAFLSACQTAMGDEKLPEEAVHLAAGMILAGYPTVIATMWSIEDSDAPLVAAKVYKRLFEGGVADTQKAAEALHEAVSLLRTKVGEKAFVRWVPYIHIGV